ncbi:MAG: periplasmic trehalase [Cyclobacteriaceae bacterium]|nr:MAG: periplasmic trehalase [Cyclobacteriaceae bacterium]
MKLRHALYGIIFLVSACQKKSGPPNWEQVFESSLFHDVQTAPVFPDSKTFPDCTPRTSWDEIISLYEKEKNKPDFDLTTFVGSHFILPDRPESSFISDTTVTLEEHIKNLWPRLTRPADETNDQSTRIALPYAYVVPGGRFAEIYYWDSYFTMLGLLAHNRKMDAVNMVNNFAWLINRYGHIPNGNRTYYLSRSQPPFFACMIALLHQHDSTALLRYLSALKKEYDFWMDGSGKLQKPGDSYRRVVLMPDGSLMNRYWDDAPRPRPEAYKEDVQLAGLSGRAKEDVYRNLRAAAESGWDFSSRWLDDSTRLETIRTTEIIPVDLNCLLYFAERTLQQGYNVKQLTDSAQYFTDRADSRRRAILTFFWNETAGFFTDYDFANSRQRSNKTLAGMFPLFFELAQPQMVTRAASIIESEFLKPGGLTTTLVNSKQQWDAPNGWAPLQYIAVTGLKQYGYDSLATIIATRWLAQNQRVFKRTGKMMEKYNVADTLQPAGGGEYPTQDGFGWTNGVAAYLLQLNQLLTSEFK